MARFPLPFRIPFFRIFYSTTYTSLFVVVLCLLAITPAALIFTAVQASAWQYPFMIGGTYVLTALLSLFIYTSRLFTNRTVLAAVGKSWIPVEEGEVGHHVRKMIANALQRSATVAWEGRPRDLSTEAEEVAEAAEKEQEKEDHEKSTHLFRHGRRHEDQYLVGSIIQVDPQAPPWGHVHHPGWSSPSKFDTQLTPHIYFTTVIRELPNLIEAKAVSLAPPDPAFTPADPSHPPWQMLR
ncbi:hypothetical protein H2203_000559 [Taxawa tesnikishii (nom. ined.)]|nr:hypothetical protein H2203_000559 [Dothideales sp. JES 119]